MQSLSDVYPPLISQEQFSRLVFDIKDWQITHGMLLKYGSNAESVSSIPVGVSIFPSLFPKGVFERAQRLQVVYNRLYAAIAENEEWLEYVLKGLIDDGGLAAVLWGIHEKVKKEGILQDVILGLFRSDYMIHIDRTLHESAEIQQLTLRQIEFNTYSVAGGAHVNKVAEMHQYMIKNGSYRFPQGDQAFNPLITSGIPKNDTIMSIAAGLKAAHAAYGGSKHITSTTPGILFVVQPRNINICDERPLEYALWQYDPPIPTYRVVFGAEVLAHTSISTSRELLFHSPSMSAPIEIAVVYMRAGYELEEYTPIGINARTRLEISRAIKCPSILCHLATFKKVQQELAVPGVLERFLSPEDTETIRETFVPMYPLDDDSEAGQKGRKLACDPQTACNYVLKTSLEGGGHNVYGVDIPHYLKSTPESQWHTYILMELISPLVQKNILLRPQAVYDEVVDKAVKQSMMVRLSKTLRRKDPPSIKPFTGTGGPTVSELGIFGVCLWERTNGGSPKITENTYVGWSFKTKPEHVNEMSVIKHFGCYDSPLLIERESPSQGRDA